MTTISLDVLKHELAHIAGGRVAGAKVCKLWHDGESWMVTNAWPSRPTDEAKALGFLSAVMLAPEEASDDDLGAVALIPADVAERLRHVVEDQVRPIWLELIADEANLLAMQETCEAEGGLVVEWDTLH